MPSGGHISCEYCTYNRSPYGRCDIFGVETSPFVLCRQFRPPGESHRSAHKAWSILSKLESGKVYAITQAGGLKNPIVTHEVKPIRRS